MYNPNDPRFRRTLNTVSQRLESANETAQISLFSISEHCLKPCFFSVSNCLTATTDAFFPSALRDERAGGLRRRRPARAPQGRLERSFDFYDDWEEDENDALLNWEEEEEEEANRLLGDGGDTVRQPPKRGVMNYGTGGTGAVIRAIGGSGGAGPRRPPRRNTGDQDPTVIPNQSFFGFLDRLPFKFGPRGLRYRPSAAGLRERPKGPKEGPREPGRRTRSDTLNSQETEDSLSSRGDIFPSDDEVEDAVALDDEFAARFMPDDASSGKTRRERRRAKRVASTESRSGTSSRRESDGGIGASVATLGELEVEEQRVRTLEERDVQAKREAAARLARQRGLSDAEQTQPADTGDDEAQSPLQGKQPTEPGPVPTETPPPAPPEAEAHEEMDK